MRIKTNSWFLFAKMFQKGFFVPKNCLSKYLSMLITIAKINPETVLISTRFTKKNLKKHNFLYF